MYLSFLHPSTASPEPGSRFRVRDSNESSISFSWVEQFDGLADITGARLEYTVVSSGKAPIGMDVGRLSGMITGLTPLNVYNVSLFVKNRLGLSDPVFLVHQTLLRGELK